MDTSRRPRLDTCTSETANHRLARLPPREADESTALILSPPVGDSPGDDDVPTKVKVKARLPARPWMMAMDEVESVGSGGRRAVSSAQDERAAMEATAVDSHVADRIAEELAIARDPGRVARFLEEAQLFSTHHHGGIAQISDVGVHGDTHYLAMEHLHGVPLRTALDRCPEGLPLDVAVTAIASCAEALHYVRSKQPAHGHRHLGIAPSYVMACVDGSVKLLRLGTTGDSTPMWTSGELAYLSPEQARGEAVDARSDVFALGVMFYELTTGAHPFLDPSSEPTGRSARDRLVHAEIQPPAERFSWFPLELSDLVMTALARDPELRYGDARVFGRAVLEVARRLSLRPGPRAVGQLVSLLLGVPSAGETRSAQLSRCFLPVAGSPRQPPLEVLPHAFPMLTADGTRASEVERVTTRSVGPSSRPRRLLRALAVLVLISATVMLAAGLGVAAHSGALPATVTMQPERSALPGGRVR